MSTDYDYPEEIDELHGRERRRAKKNWRRDDHAQRMAWLRDQRQAEPTSPVVIVVVVVVLAIVILGLGGGLPRLLGGKGTDDGAPIGVLTPGRPVVLPTAPSNPAKPAHCIVRDDRAHHSAAADPAPVGEVDGNSHGRGRCLGASVLHTRSECGELCGAGGECAKYMTEEVAASFTAAGDPTYEALKSDGGKSTVIAAPVSAPPANAEAPVDTPTRITRFVKVTIDVTGKHPQRFDVPLLVTLVNQDGQWKISEVSGGTGP